jgi:hypothetical protein
MDPEIFGVRRYGSTSPGLDASQPIAHALAAPPQAHVPVQHEVYSNSGCYILGLSERVAGVRYPQQGQQHVLRRQAHAAMAYSWIALWPLSRIAVLRPDDASARAGGSPQRVHDSIRAQNFFRSTFPPETIATIGPWPAFPVNAAASASAPAPSAMTRAFSASSRIAFFVSSRLTTI